MVNKKHKIIELEGEAYMLLTTDKEVHELQMNGPCLKWAIDDFYNTSIRSRLKHTKLTKKEAELLDKLREELFECCKDLL